MNPTFTPRNTPREETRKPSRTAKDDGKVIIHTSLWRQLRPHLVMIVRWLVRLIRKFVSILMRYIHNLTKTQRIQHAAIIVGLIVLCFVCSQIFSRKPHSSQTAQTGGSSAQLPKETPDFSAVLPSGKSVSDYGGWTRVSPEDRNAVYAYTDTIDNVSIIVSEQPLPDSFKSDPSGSIQKLAESYSADRTFEANGTVVYIGKSAKGPQSLIFTAHDLLILIKSSATVSDEHWIRYITSLR